MRPRTRPTRRPWAGAACAMAALIAGGAQAQETIMLRVADSLPAGHYIARYAAQAWMDSVVERTGGQVSFQHFPAGQLGGAGDMLTMLETGVADVTYVVPAYLSQRLPLSMVGNLPADYAHPCDGTRAFWSLISEGGALWERELVPLGVRPLFALMLPTNQIVMGEGFSSLADLDGRKLRSSGGNVDIFINELGAVPIRIGAAELYQALSRRTVDGLVIPLLSLLPYDLHTISRAVTTDTNLGGFAITYSISEASWRQLPEAVRAAMSEAGEQVTREACGRVADDTVEAIEVIVGAGVEVVELSAEDDATLTRIAAEIATRWADEMEAIGRPGREILAAFEASLHAGSN